MSREPDGTLTCDMGHGCADPVTMIDRKGFIYCTGHGESRKTWGTAGCRKLRPYELNRLLKGQQLAKY